jgi:glycosyltransferase involved in cell wall biosynthesis
VFKEGRVIGRRGLKLEKSLVSVKNEDLTPRKEERAMKRVGFISTRIAGTDGVSLETFKWYQVLERNGFECFFFAGQLETPPECSFLEPKAHFEHPEIQEIQHDCFGKRVRSPFLTSKVHELRGYLKSRLYAFYDAFHPDFLIAENALAIPMNVPLGMAITEFIAETGIPTIAHHHDFAWERDRFLICAIQDYVHYAFPPTHPSIHHVTINSNASRQLSYRRGLSNVVVPNVFDFANPPQPSEKMEVLRESLGFKKDELFILQPTRVVPRKWIERAIELVYLMELPNPRLVISHKSGDEGSLYESRVKEYAKRLGVELIFIGGKVGAARCFKSNYDYDFTIDDVYQCADLVTYPSGYEGFGNAFVEAIYFKKPLVANRYSIFIEDIEPIGFDVVSFDGFVTHEIVEQVKAFLESDVRMSSMEKNYRLGQAHLSYEVLEEKLLQIIRSFN